jgi:hypothetical protein
MHQFWKNYLDALSDFTVRIAVVVVFVLMTAVCVVPTVYAIFLFAHGHSVYGALSSVGAFMCFAAVGAVWETWIK